MICKPFTIKLIAACAGFMPAMCLFAQQNTAKYPDRAIQMIVPFGPGGTTDIMARLLQDELGKALGKDTSIVIVNTAGAGGLIGMQNTARAKPDGYTIAMTTTGPQTLQPARRENPTYTPDQFDYICGTYDVPVMAMVAQDSPFKTYSDLVKFAKANPGKLNYGISGIGGVLHLSMIELTQESGSQAVAVPFKSTGDMIVPLKTQQIQFFNETPTVATQHQLRPLIALSDTPVLGFENVPTAKSLNVKTRGSVWGGLVAPKGLPADIRAKLETACQAATSTTIYKARAQAAFTPLAYRTGDQFKRFALAEHDKFKQVVKQHNLQEK
ncbi:MAG: tripartite tricarboxylate transporter substrate binding protein [Burkholderiales bacterium]|nr:MAG: tripartite tricarboxylate transporter substrate binding protein [Burkholderiales bacterium]